MESIHPNETSLFFEGMIGCSDFFRTEEAFPSDFHLALGLPELPKSKWRSRNLCVLRNGSKEPVVDAGFKNTTRRVSLKIRQLVKEPEGLAKDLFNSLVLKEFAKTIESYC